MLYLNNMKCYICMLVIGCINFICTIILYFLHILPKRYEIIILAESCFVMASVISQVLILAFVYGSSNRRDNRIVSANSNVQNERSLNAINSPRIISIPIRNINTITIPNTIQNESDNNPDNYINEVSTEVTNNTIQKSIQSNLYICELDTTQTQSGIQIGNNDIELVIIMNP